MAAANHCGRIAACCLALLRYGHVEWVTASVATTHRAGDEPSLLRGRGGEGLARPHRYGFRNRRDRALREGTGLFLELFQLPGTVALADRKL